VLRILDLHDTAVHYGTGTRGWKGDVPVVRFSSARVRGRGWTNRHTTEAALRSSIDHLLTESPA
jgi:UDP-glucose 4-epimerase